MEYSGLDKTSPNPELCAAINYSWQPNRNTSESPHFRIFEKAFSFACFGNIVNMKTVTSYYPSKMSFKIMSYFFNPFNA